MITCFLMKFEICIMNKGGKVAAKFFLGSVRDKMTNHKPRSYKLITVGWQLHYLLDVEGNLLQCRNHTTGSVYLFGFCCYVTNNIYLHCSILLSLYLYIIVAPKTLIDSLTHNRHKFWNSWDPYPEGIMEACIWLS